MMQLSPTVIPAATIGKTSLRCKSDISERYFSIASVGIQLRKESTECITQAAA